MNLTKNFRLNEFIVSSSYPELAKKIYEEYITYEMELSLRILCLECLQPIRDMFGTTNILSGLRSTELNDKIGGSKTSDHLNGFAADFYVHNLEECYKWIVNHSHIKYRQVILYKDKNFIHISSNNKFNLKKHDALIYKNGNYIKYNDNIR
jgi:hypothetical protein